MKVSGFSIIRDGERFGYPFLQSVRSILPLVDEFVWAVGKSSDGTLERARSLKSPKLRIIETEWDETLCTAGQVMAQQTNLALDQCTGDWCFYLQGDEVLHEEDYPTIRLAMQRHHANPRVEGLSFRYRHFYGSYRLLSTRPYRRQTRIIRNGIGVRSIGDACGFALNHRKLRSKRSGAQVYHYGWVREPSKMAKKLAQFAMLYGETQQAGESEQPSSVEKAAAYEYRTSGCVRFQGSHPRVMQEVIAAQNWPEPDFDNVPLWRSKNWWRGVFEKNFATISRRLPGSHQSSLREAPRAECGRVV